VEQRLLAPAALRPRAAQPPGPNAVDNPPVAGGEREREREARTQGHRPVCGGSEARARDDWREAGEEAADAVAEIPSLSAAADACVPSATMKMGDEETAAAVSLGSSGEKVRVKKRVVSWDLSLC
jgi:hypothetical protein